MADSSWRDADRQVGRGTRPASVRGVVRRSYLGLAAARWGEGVLIGTGVLCFTLAVAVYQSLSLGDPGLWVVAVVVGTAAGLSWRLEHRKGPGDVARMLDRRLRHYGALLTAFEVEGRGNRSPVAESLRARVLDRLRTREALHAVAPPLAVPLAAPLLGVAVLAVALDLADDEPAGVRLDPGAMANQVAGLQDRALDAMDEGTVDADTARALSMLETKIERAATALDRGEEDDALRRRIEALDRELVQLRARTGHDPEIAKRLDAVRPHLDAVRMGLGEGSPETGGGETAAPGETGDGRNSTMPGPSATASPAPEEAAPGPAASGPDPGASPEVGSTAGRWWRSEYDAIVARWVEHQRREEPRPGSPPTEEPRD